MYVHVWVCTCHGVHVPVRPFVGVSSLLPPCGTWGLNSAQQTSWWVPLPSEHSCWPPVTLHLCNCALFIIYSKLCIMIKSYISHIT